MIQDRIKQLRALMAERKIDVYYIPNEDDHLSDEYTADYFKCKSYMSGFSGESGCTIITKDFAGLWTDGRFFTQAENELQGTGVTLMRLRQEGVPNPIDFLIANTPKNGVLGFDGAVVSARNYLHLTQALKEKNAKLYTTEDLVGMVWGKDRPAMPTEELYVLPKKYTGEEASLRIARVREAMKASKCDAILFTALEDPCWLLNIRGNDIACTPVSYAFAAITNKKLYYYVDSKKINAKVAKYFKENKVTVRPYNALMKDLKQLEGKKIWADMGHLNSNLYKAIAGNEIYDAISPVAYFRAIKNKTEIKNIRNAHVKDAVAMVKFISWVKSNVAKGKMTEVTAQDHLYALRAEQKDYIEPSFETICAYQENAAMMHYTATKEKHAAVKPKGFLLVDSGGTYKDGTTDITRTIAVGELTAEEKKLYTKVLKGHLDLLHAKFLYGTTGNNLDILARNPLWNDCIDYQCGTGHGVGHVLAVHEGPHGIRWGMPANGKAVVLQEGMVVTNEPGVYLPHKLGIRIENEMIVQKEEKNFYGQFLSFEDITYVPYDRDAIDTKYLSDEEIDWINAYHKMIWEKIGPLLSGKEKSFLKKATGKITRA